MITQLNKDGEMIVIFSSDEKDFQIWFLESLQPINQEQFDEITILLNIIRHIPNLKIVN